jgi:hypothetical protein
MAQANHAVTRVRGTKTKDRDRFVPVVTDWQRELLAHVKEHADGKDGALVSPWGSALRSITQAAKRAQIRHMNRHGLRHCYSAWMKQEGVPLSELYLAMGHASTQQLERTYGKPDGKELVGMMTQSIPICRAALTVIDGGRSQRRRGPKPASSASRVVRVPALVPQPLAQLVTRGSGTRPRAGLDSHRRPLA